VTNTTAKKSAPSSAMPTTEARKFERPGRCEMRDDGARTSACAWTSARERQAGGRDIEARMLATAVPASRAGFSSRPPSSRSAVTARPATAFRRGRRPELADGGELQRSRSHLGRAEQHQQAERNKPRSRVRHEADGGRRARAETAQHDTVRAELNASATSVAVSRPLSRPSPPCGGQRVTSAAVTADVDRRARRSQTAAS